MSNLLSLKSKLEANNCGGVTCFLKIGQASHNVELSSRPFRAFGLSGISADTWAHPGLRRRGRRNKKCHGLPIVLYREV
jgi:hypothetical protein